MNVRIMEPRIYRFAKIITLTIVGRNYDAGSLCDTPQTETKFLALNVWLGFDEGDAQPNQTLHSTYHRIS